MPVGRSTIGVLEDEPEMRKALRRLLTCRGFQVEEYERGADLLAAVGSQRLHCLLLDLHMEGVKGFDVLEAFLARQIHVLVIVITAHDEPGTAKQVSDLGAVAYAISHLRTPLVVVLGREGCGAIEAALATKYRGVKQRSRIQLRYW
jgi:FixJ family two-component response regulator